MTFLNVTLLFGALAFVIPLAIHLLNRTRFRSLEWGAMLFLEDAERVNSRRFDWQKWLLLFLRCAIPICLAICMANPLLQSGIVPSQFIGGQSIANCLLIDNSLSMETKIVGARAGEATAFDKVKADSLAIIEAAPRNSRWSISPIGSEPEESLDFIPRDVTQLSRYLDGMPRVAGGVELLAAIDEAVSKLASRTESRRRIVVFSDFQKSMCQAIEPSQVTNLRQRMQESSIRPELLLVPIDTRDSAKQTYGNVTIRIDPRTPSLIAAGQPWEVRIIVKNFGATDAQAMKLTLSVDGLPTYSKALDLSGGAETQLSFGMVFPKPGSHRLEASLDRNEALVADNQATWSILALSEIAVLIVDPTLNDRNRPPDSEFLSAALAPFGEQADEAANLFQINRMTPGELASDKIERYKTILLVNVPELDNELIEPMKQYVRNGGILAIFAGDQIHPEWYNQQLAKFKSEPTSDATSSTEQPFLPYLFERQPTLIKPNEMGMKIRHQGFFHPALSFLNDVSEGSLDNIEVRGWFRMLSNSTDDEEAQEILALANGDILIGSRTFGAGSVLQCATSGNDRWTDWPLRPMFLPMIQHLLVHSSPLVRWPCNVETGQRLSLPSATTSSWIENATRDDTFVWKLPNSEERESKPINARYPGLYRLKPHLQELSTSISEPSSPNDDAKSNLATNSGSRSISNPSETLYLSAQSPLAESNIELESESGIRSLADRLGANVIESFDEFQDLGDRDHRELWRWLLIGLLILLFGELFLQRGLAGVIS